MEDAGIPHAVRSGAIALILRASRPAGVAPFPVVSGVTRLVTIIVRATAIVISIFMSYAVIIDEDMVQSDKTDVSRGLWTSNIFFLCTLNIVGIFGAPSRFHGLIQSFRRLETVSLDSLDSSKLKRAEKLKIFQVALYLIVHLGLQIVSYIVNFLAVEEKFNLRGVFATLTSLCYLVQHQVLMLLMFQFVLLAQHVLLAQQAVNETLQELHSALKLQELKTTTVPSKNRIISIFREILLEEPTVETECSKPGVEPKHKTIRHLACSYCCVRDVVGQSVDNGEVVVILIIIITLINLLHFTQIELLNIGGDPSTLLFNVFLVAVLIFYFITLVLLIEPCHQVHNEVDRTQKLIYNLKQCRRHCTEELLNELELFRRILQLSKPEYSPLGVCVLARPLLFKIFGGMVTYLVIIMQI